MRLRDLALAACLLPLSGCASLGAARVSIDRADYAERLRQSEKEQLLSNIVAMRLGDAPLFLSVTSVISQYTREASGHLGAGLSPPHDSTGQADGSVLFRESPTVTYTPMTGDRFARTLLSPAPPETLLAMVEAGWAVDDLFELTVRSIRGVRNESRAPMFAQVRDPAFLEMAQALRRLQLSGALSTRVVERDKRYAAVVRLGPDLSPADQADVAFLRQRLKGAPAGALEIVFASDAGGPGELAVATRSLFEVLQEICQGVDLTESGGVPAGALVRVHSGPDAPAGAHVAIRRGGRWFWIAADDERSKRFFLLVQVMVSLNDDTAGAHAPVVTLPAG